MCMETIFHSYDFVENEFRKSGTGVLDRSKDSQKGRKIISGDRSFKQLFEIKNNIANREE